MAFPVTSVLDTFTGTNGADLPVYSANWSAQTGAVNLEIQGNAATSSSAALGANYWNVSNFGPNCEVYATISTKQADGDGLDLVARAQQESSLSTLDGYGLELQVVAGTDTVAIIRIDNGTGTVLGSAVGQEIGAGDALGLEIIGNTLMLYRKPSGGSWATLGSLQTDSTYPNAGKLELLLVNTVVRVDDFGGGTIPAGSGGGVMDDRFRFRPSVTSSYTAGQAFKRSAWPEDSRDFSRRDNIADNRSRAL